MRCAGMGAGRGRGKGASAGDGAGAGRTGRLARCRMRPTRRLTSRDQLWCKERPARLSGTSWNQGDGV
eukprot:12758387-Prorocentrum_lima.AAC.1